MIMYVNGKAANVIQCWELLPPVVRECRAVICRRLLSTHCIGCIYAIFLCCDVLPEDFFDII